MSQYASPPVLRCGDLSLCRSSICRRYSRVIGALTAALLPLLSFWRFYRRAFVTFRWRFYRRSFALVGALTAAFFRYLSWALLPAVAQVPLACRQD